MKELNRLLHPEEPRSGVTKGEAAVFSSLLTPDRQLLLDGAHRRVKSAVHIGVGA